MHLLEIMDFRKLFIALMTFLAIILLGMQLKENEQVASVLRALLMIFIILLYVSKPEKMQRCFLLFLGFFGLAEISNSLSFFIPFNEELDPFYYIVNGLYVLAYATIVAKLVRRMNFKVIIKKFPVHLIILLLLDFYFVYMFNDILKEMVYFEEQIIESLYNGLIMVMLSMSFLNYLERDDKSSLFLFAGSSLVVLSEVFQMTYFYVKESFIINFLYCILMILAFLCFYRHSRLDNEGRECNKKLIPAG